MIHELETCYPNNIFHSIKCSWATCRIKTEHHSLMMQAENVPETLGLLFRINAAV